MSAINYVKTLWVDNATPPINAANLNNIENGLEALDQSAVLSGTSINRPTSPGKGTFYFDIDLGMNGGMPIWHTGLNWVDAAGNIV